MSVPPSRTLVVNGDDFGRSPGVVDGVVRAHEEGILTSASLMVRWPAAAAAAEAARRHPRLGVGLHVDLGEWIHRDDGWEAVYEVCDGRDGAAVEAEVARQLRRFRDLIGRDPTHLDSHQHVHRAEPVRAVLRRHADALGVPLRDVTPGIRYVGDFYGQTGTGEPLHDRITAAALAAVIDGLGPGVSEIGCHPGTGADAGPPYDVERDLEVLALCSVEARRAVEAGGIALRPFGDLHDRPRAVRRQET